MACAVCGGTNGAAEMTDGRSRAVLCDDCRQMTVVFWHVHGSLDVAVNEARTARGSVKPVSEAEYREYLAGPLDPRD